MPLVRTLGAGAEAAASAVAVWSREITIADDNQEFTPALLVYGMPRLTFYVRQTAGALGATVQPQFAVRGTGGVGTQAVDWQVLDAAYVVNPNVAVPTVRNYIVSARLIRLALIRPAGQATSLQIILTASL